jgi:flagellar motor switch protein FliM
MVDLLDQSEVDALLSSLDSPGDDAGSAGAGTEQVFSSRKRRENESFEIRPYDFKRPERVSKDQMRALETLHESFGRTFASSLSGFLRTIVEIKVAHIEQMTYSEFIQGLPNPTCFNLLSCQPLEGQMCMEISPLIIYPIIDRLLGGSNADLFIPQRPLTVIESGLVSKVTDRAMAALSEAWEGVVAVTFDLLETESNPQFVQIVPPNEVVVVVGFELKMGGRAGTMSLCIPFNVIEPIMEKLVSQAWQAYRRGRGNENLRRRLVGKLERAPLRSSALLAETSITISDLLNMAPGDLIMTDKPASRPVVFAIEGKKKFLANLGQFKGKRAMKILRPISPKDRV